MEIHMGFFLIKGQFFFSLVTFQIIFQNLLSYNMCYDFWKLKVVISMMIFFFNWSANIIYDFKVVKLFFILF